MRVKTRSSGLTYLLNLQIEVLTCLQTLMACQHVYTSEKWLMRFEV